MKELSPRTYGIALVAAASVFWSTAGLFVRALDLDVWTMTAWRSLFAALSLLLVVVLQRGRGFTQAFTGLGRPGLIAIPISAVSMFCYVAALKLTTVANVQIVYATVPFVAAAVAFVWFGERMTRRAMWASVLALVGVAVMVGSAVRTEDLAGNALALLMTLTFAVVLVTARRHPSIDMAPVNALAAALCAAACWPLAVGDLPSASQLLILALFGFTTTALSYLLFLTGGRHIPSGEAGLIALLDVVLAPFWVWLVFSEHPGQAAIVGGAVVLAAVVWYLAGNLAEGSRRVGKGA
jgi:drug/metabolite transporter (DMT)-like permease